MLKEIPLYCIIDVHKIKTIIYTKKKQDESSNLKFSSGAIDEKNSKKNESSLNKSSLKFSIIEDDKSNLPVTPIIDKSMHYENIIDKSMHYENIIEDSFENSKRYNTKYVSSLYIYKDFTPPFDFHKNPLIFSRGIKSEINEKNEKLYVVFRRQYQHLSFSF